MKDNLLGTLTNLRVENYTFNAYEGTQQNRFQLLFNNSELGINDSVQNNQIKVYPNPTEGLIHISFQTNEEKMVLSVYDITGRLVLQQNMPNKNNNTLDVSNFMNGVYFLRINDTTVRFIKE